MSSINICDACKNGRCDNCWGFECICCEVEKEEDFEEEAKRQSRPDDVT